MNTSSDLIVALRGKDVRLSVDGDRLVVNAPKDALREDELVLISRHKKEIIASLLQSGRAHEGLSITPCPRDDPIPLSSGQQRLWLTDQLRGGETREYHIPMGVRLSGKLDRLALKAALDGVVERHEILRTVYASDSGVPRQVILAARGFALQEMSLQGQPADEQAAELARQATEEESAPFNLSAGPVIRGRLLQLNDSEHVLLLTLHHIAADGWSLGIFVRELVELYAAHGEGRAPRLAALPVQYADYAVWESKRLEGAWLQGQLAYWMDKLRAAPVLALPGDRANPARFTYSGGVQSVPLSKEICERVRALMQAADATVYMIMLATFYVLLSRWCGQEDLVVASPVGWRPRQETEGLIGFFVNLALLRVSVDGSQSFRGLLSRVKHAVLGAYANEDLPFDKLMAELRAERGIGAGALARVAFTTTNLAQARGVQMPGLKLEPLSSGSAQSGASVKNDLLLIVQEGVDGWDGRFEYSTQVFDAATIERLGRRFCRMLEQMLAFPDARLDELDFTLPFEAGERAGTPILPTARQRALWSDLFAHTGSAGQRDIAGYLQMEGRVDPLTFERAVQYVTDRTAALRVSLQLDASGRLNQSIAAVRCIRVPLIDLSSAGEPRQAAQEWMDVQRRNRIGLVADVPWSCALLKLGAERFCGYWQYHPLIADEAACLQIVARVGRAYTSLEGGLAPAIGDDAADYARYFHDDAEYRYSVAFCKDQAYWRAQGVTDAPALGLFGSSTPTAESLRSERTLRDDRVAVLRHRAAAVGVSIVQFTIAAVVLYLQRISGSAQIRVDLEAREHSSARPHGLAVPGSSAVPLQLRVSAELTVEQAIRQIASQAAEAPTCGRFVLEDSESLRCMRSSDVRVQVVTEDSTIGLGSASGRVYSFSKPAQGLLVRLAPADDERSLTISLEGAPAQCALWELQVHGARLEEFLERLAVTDLLQPLGSLDVLSNSERQRILLEFNPPLRASPQDSVVAMFETQVTRVPNAVAVVCADQQLTYMELHRRSNQVAQLLRMYGAGPDGLVGICTDRVPEMLVAVLGVMKAGAAYLPLDPTYPPQRIKFMVEDSSLQIVLTQSRHKDALLRDVRARTIELDGGSPDLAQWPESSPGRAELSPAHLAYVIYTSGSTGRAKAAAIQHRGLCSLLQWYRQEIDLQATDRVLIASSFSFDLTQKNFLAPMWVGAQIHLTGEPFDAAAVVTQIAECGITHLNLTPSTFHLLVEAEDAQPGAFSSLRYVCLGGEPINRGRIARLASEYPRLQILNSYGPTECSDVATVHRLPAQWASDPGATVPIGSPIPNARIYILDKREQPAPIGMPGEIYIGGVGVARGYLGRPQMTAARFLGDPFNEQPLARMYRTGDLGRWRPEGVIEYQGRNDGQLKIRGHRIEPGEIEWQLSRHEQIGEAVVLAREDGAGDRTLAAYLTVRAGSAVPAIASLREHLRAHLPEYMIPAAYVLLESIPLTPNGKVDRTALAALQDVPYDQAPYAPPEGEIEETLAAIWRELLRVQQVGRHDNFFELGGHSLLAVQLVSRIRARFTLELPVREVFAAPELALLAERIADRQLAEFDSQDLLEIVRHMPRGITGHSAGDSG